MSEKPICYRWIDIVLQSDLPSHARLLAFILVTYMNEKRTYAYPSLRTLSKQASLSLNSVRSHLDSLENSGYLEISRRQLNKSGQFHNIYRIKIPLGVSKIDTPLVSTTDTRGVSNIGKGCVNHCAKVYQPLTLNIQKNIQRISNTNKSIEPTLNLVPSPNELNSEGIVFDEFWEQYPRKQKRKESEKLWNKIKPTEKQKIVPAIKKAIAIDWNFREKHMIPLPTTWLRGECWNDEIIDRKGSKNERENNWQHRESRSKRYSDELTAIAKRDIEQNGLTDSLDNRAVSEVSGTLGPSMDVKQ